MIRFEDIQLSFGKQQVLRDIDFHVKQQQVTALVGPSGSGKSTILKLMMGFMCPDSGSIQIDGEEVSDCTEHKWIRIRRKMGMVFQNSALFDSMSVIQNVGFYPHYVERLPWAKVRPLAMDILGEVGLLGHAHKLPAQLSGGMRRRVALARSLIYRPKILLYDEPTTGLDPIMIEVVNELIEEMNARYGVTSVVVSHDMDCIQAVADSVVLISHGESCDVGTPADLLNSTEPRVMEFTANWRRHILDYAGEIKQASKP